MRGLPRLTNDDLGAAGFAFAVTDAFWGHTVGAVSALATLLIRRAPVLFASIEARRPRGVDHLPVRPEAGVSATVRGMADARFQYLLDKYRQEVPGHAPWPRINTVPDDGLQADLQIAHELRGTYGPNTREGAVGGGVIGGWLAQALRMRPALLQYPNGLV